MSIIHELSYMSTVELAMHIRNRKLSPVEVVDSFIQRIEKRNETLNAFVYFAFDDARNKAKEAEKAIISGEEIGPLHGVPTAVKDLFNSYPGWPNTLGGIRALKDYKNNIYNSYAKRMEDAGAIILGKTNSSTMGFRGVTDNYLFGPTRNPFNLSKNAGGSSGGSAAAVADGLLPIAAATDAGGSIRIPASWCGLYGYKASFGRIPFVGRPNAFGPMNPFHFEGTLTRSVEDAAVGLNVMSGYNPRDPFSLDETIDFTQSLQRSIKGMKIAYSPDFDVFPVEPEVKVIVKKAAMKFEELGATVEEVKFGINRHQRELSDVWSRLEAMSYVEKLEEFKKSGIDLMKDHRDDIPVELMRWLEEGYNLTIHDIIRDQQIRTEIYDAIQNVFEDYDLIITPTLACHPVNNATDGNTIGPTSISGEEVDPLIGWCLTYFTNFSGHPSASIPAGLSESQLPVGMQIIGKRYGDKDVLAASAAFERISPWQDIYKLIEIQHI